MSIAPEFLEDATKDLITLGVSLARHIHDRATTEPEADLEAASKAFERVSRGTRRAILLARKLAEPPRAPRLAVRKRIIRDVEDAIQRETGGEEADTLQAELLDRLDSLDLEDEIGHRPVAEIVTDITRDLGLAHYPGTHPWKRRTPEDVAALHARAAAPPVKPTPPATTPPATRHTPPPVPEPRPHGPDPGYAPGTSPAR